jgi:hypothetical protein
MKFKKEKYFGEIWLPEQEENKQFCFLEIVENEIFIHSNLICSKSSYKVGLIYGFFNDLGSLTFVNCTIYRSETGIINYKKYSPDYVFASSNHIIEPVGLRLKTIEIENNSINNLIRSFHIANPLINKVEIESVKIHEIKINDDLTISLYKNYSVESNKFGTNIINQGILKIDFINQKSILESIEIYKKFQKFCIIFFSGIEKFNSFKSVCLECGKNYNILFNDNLANTHHQGIFNEEFLKDEDVFYQVISNWYNNDDVAYCFDIVIENYLSKKVSNARRFTNSISSFEAFYKLFSSKKHSHLCKQIVEFKDVFERIDNKIKNFDDFTKKIVRIRDYYVHGNRNQDVKHDNFDLLYYSLLFDFVVIRELSKELNFNDEYLKEIEMKGASVFKHQLPINRMLESNNIID